MPDTTTAPPRLPPAQDSMAALDQRIAERRIALKALGAFDIDGCTTFGAADADTVDDILRDIIGTTMLLEHAFTDADKDSSGMVAEGRDVFTSRAFAAIHKLAVLAAFINEGNR